MKKIQLLLFVLVVVNFCMGQSTNPLDQKYQPPTNSIFSENNTKATSNERSERKSNIFGLVVTDFARSNFRLEYERKIFDRFSLTASGSFAFGSDFIEKSLNLYVLTENDSYSSSEKKLTQLYHDSKFESGYGYSFSLKYYFSLDGSIPMFWDIGWRNSTTNHIISETSGYNSNSLQFKTSVNHLYFFLGNTLTSGSGKVALTHVFSYGFSLKFAKFDKYKNQPYVDYYYNSVDSYVKQNEKSSMTSMAFLFKYELGFGW